MLVVLVVDPNTVGVLDAVVFFFLSVFVEERQRAWSLSVQPRRHYDNLPPW